MAHPTQRSRSPRAAMPQNQGSSKQRIWDACLLLGFRNRATLDAVFEMFKMTTGMIASDGSLMIKRMPLPEHMDNLDNISVDYFLRNHLQTVHERAFKGRPEYDNILIGKMQEWNYDTHPVRLANTSHKKLNSIADYHDRISLNR